jgi:NAD(P)-dependent dehydrogenase (short-subunit alcohol dehydrogenase family)
MSSNLSAKTAVVTGGARGIGLAIAETLAAQGVRVAIAGRDQRALEEAAKTLGGDAFAHPCDIRAPRSVTDFFTAVHQRFGRLDFLINNAGLAHPVLNVDNLAVDIWRDVIETNLTGMFLCTGAALPLMQRGAAIVNNISVAGKGVFPGESAYCASKWGALGFTNTLREELRERGIRVIALVPGPTQTDIWNQFWPEAPRDRMMSPQTVATALVNALSLPGDATVEELVITPTAGTL